MAGRVSKANMERNRIVDGVDERRCRKCEEWKPLTGFTWYSSYYGYRCRECVKEYQTAYLARTRGAMRYLAKHPGTPQFDESKVDVKGLLRFSTMPTPQQLIERNAAA